MKNLKRYRNLSGFIVVLIIMLSEKVQAQQDPGFTQYMYNTMSVNPAYAGSKKHTVINILARSQWAGIDGAPETQTLSYDTSLKYSGVGIGFNVTNDKIGPAQKTSIDANVSYSLQVTDASFLALGLKLGGRLFNVDWSKGIYKNPDRVFDTNVDNEFSPTVGLGAFFYNNKFYIGASIPNVLKTNNYSASKENVALEKEHMFLIAGYVFDINRDLKFKPALLFKAVMNAPSSLDVSANFLYLDKFRGSVSYRWNDAISALIGFQVTDNLNVGYAYDLTTSNYGVYNTGTHEFMLRYEIFSKGPEISPRFF
ncbi:type IX secretion system membrane protein PorP/SprF [Aureibaculum sp. A20]|uniref:Type IX secretion system membrane protein PorP/SprF n=1 Tax=Aureibaculum flavum TaxID=2795986 RepID=A0ABS0WN30_9FLAO|nr:type IX secretion system membrane protein PorP/SprF [Aureibaculum flavum]MBJ2173383.1 type IX secretion system membrane protein PorP/SprF [Aureibaculum flavum]